MSSSKPPPSIDQMLEKMLPRVHEGACPKCGADGPTDLHRAYWIISLIHWARWGTDSLLGCRKCGAAHQRMKLLQTALVGWWSLPGLLLTPVQLYRTLIALLLPPSPGMPSAQLRAHVRVQVEELRREAFLPRCPECNLPYDPDDYREDAEQIFCAGCKRALPRS